MLKRLNTQMKKSALLRIIVLVLGCSLLGGLLIWGIFSNFGFLLARSTPFPINMHSYTQANYQKDPDYMQIPPMDIQLVIDAIWDLNLNSQNLSTRLTQVNDDFIASVASVTPRPTTTNTSVPEFTPSSTQFDPTPTTNLTPSSTHTETPIGFIVSPTATSTNVLPTESPSIPTNTVNPPTNTVTACGALSLSGFNTDTKKANWTVSNSSSSSVTINSISISWPSSNSDLSKVFFGQAKIWEDTASPPSITVGNLSENLAGGTSKILSMFFTDQTASSGYNLTINYSAGCIINKAY